MSLSLIKYPSGGGGGGEIFGVNDTTLTDPRNFDFAGGDFTWNGLNNDDTSPLLIGLNSVGKIITLTAAKLSDHIEYNDIGLNRPNLTTTSGYTDVFGPSIVIKGNVSIAQVCDACGYASTPMYGFSTIRTSNDITLPGVFQIGNYTVTNINSFFELNLTNGNIKIPTLASGNYSMAVVLGDGSVGINGLLAVFADNTAAITGGLTIGNFYRTGDIVKVVH